MKFSAGAGVCPNAAKATTSAAPKPTAFQPANMRLIIPPAFVSVHLLCGRNRFGARGPGFTAERQLEFPGNLRPEFAQHIETHVLQDAVAHALRCWRETAFVVHVIRIAQRDRARRPQPFGKIEHAPAIIAVRHHRVFHRMEQSPPAAAARQPVVTRVFREYRGVRKVLKEPGRGLIGEFGAKAPPIALRPLSITGVRVLRLVNPRAEAGGEKRHRVKGILDEQNEFVFQLEHAQYRAGLVVRGGAPLCVPTAGRTCPRPSSTARHNLLSAPSAPAERTLPPHSSRLPPAKAQRLSAEEELAPAAAARKPRCQPLRPAPPRRTFLPPCENGFGVPRSAPQPIIFARVRGLPL